VGATLAQAAKQSEQQGRAVELRLYLIASPRPRGFRQAGPGLGREQNGEIGFRAGGFSAEQQHRLCQRLDRARYRVLPRIGAD
jgi:hypothetical protein